MSANRRLCAILVTALTCSCQQVLGFERFRRAAGDPDSAIDMPGGKQPVHEDLASPQPSGDDFVPTTDESVIDQPLSAAEQDDPADEAHDSPCATITSCLPGTCVDEVDGYRCACPDDLPSHGSSCCPADSIPNLAGTACRELSWSAPLRLRSAPLIGAAGTSFDVDMAEDGTATLAWIEALMPDAQFGCPAKLQALSYQPAAPTEWTQLQNSPELFSDECLHDGTTTVAALAAAKAVIFTQLLSGSYLTLDSAFVSNGTATDLKDHTAVASGFTIARSVARVATNGVDLVLLVHDATDSGTMLTKEYVNQFELGSGWLEPVTLLQSLNEELPWPAVDIEGNSLLVAGGEHKRGNGNAWLPAEPAPLASTPIRAIPAGLLVAGTPPTSVFDFETGWLAVPGANGNASSVAAIDPTGRIIHLWVDDTLVREQQFADGTWSAPRTLFRGAEPMNLQLTVTTSGDAIATWTDSPNFDDQDEVRAAVFYAATRAWGNARLVAAPMTTVTIVRAAMASLENAIVVWATEGAPQGYFELWNSRLE